MGYVQSFYKDKQHHDRYARYVNLYGLLCQECGGSGEVVEERYSFGDYCLRCGWCEGTGMVTKWARGQWLRLKKQEKK